MILLLEAQDEETWNVKRLVQWVLFGQARVLCFNLGWSLCLFHIYCDGMFGYILTLMMEILLFTCQHFIMFIQYGWYWTVWGYFSSSLFREMQSLFFWSILLSCHLSVLPFEFAVFGGYIVSLLWTFYLLSLFSSFIQRHAWAQMENINSLLDELNGTLT